MLKKIVRRILEPRHFWREVGFNELSELYVSTMLRSLAINILMVFVPFYLYQHGYLISQIFMMFGFFFVTRFVSDLVAGFTVARFGPKHTMIVSCILQIISAGMFLTVPDHHWSVWLLGAPWGAAFSFFFIAYHVEFSKIKHTEHAGKEIGYMNILDKVGVIIGPLLGGIVGTLYGSRTIFLIATLILFGSLWPLFRTAEAVKTHQKLNFKDFPLARVKRDLFAWAALGVENTLCINMWPLYVALFALSGPIYAQLGALSSFAVVASMTAAYVIGRAVDKRHARLSLRVAAILNALVYGFRPFVNSLVPAFAVNVVNEAVTVGYRLPFTKGLYAAADDLPGFRIVYMVSLESLASITKATWWFLLAMAAQLLSAKSVFIAGFAVAALASLLVMTERFKALDS